MTASPIRTVKLFRWAGWASMLLAALTAAAFTRHEFGPQDALSAAAGWICAGAALLLGVAVLLLCRLAAALTLARQEADDRTRELIDSEARTRVILETAADGIITIDDQGTIQSFNAAAERIFGYSPQEVIGKSVNRLMPPPHRDQHDEYITRRLQAGEDKGIGAPREREGRRKDGTLIPIETAVSEVSLPGRRLFAGIVRDISDRMRTEQALHESKRFLQNVIDGTSDPLLVIDRHWRVVLANRAALALAGRDTTRLDGLCCFQLSHRRDSPCEGTDHPCPLNEVVRSKAPVIVTHTHFDGEGNEVVVEISASPILDESGDVAAIIELCRDITARVHAEERVRQHQAELAHVARLGTMGEMATGLAHELNQPLAAIVNYIQACLERIRAGARDPAELLDDMQQAAAQAERAGDMIEHIRNFVRGREPKRSVVDLNTLVEDAASLVRSEVRRAGVEMSLELTEGLPPVTAQAIQIEQTIVNLIRNGLEAVAGSGNGTGELAIRTARSGDHAVEFVIRDTGQGMSEKTLSRVFDPFYTTKPNGMGMGLSISRTIIDTHGGNMWAARNPDRGATFGFSLPIHEGEARDAS
jgi:two-component system sensor kinase FixL